MSDLETEFRRLVTLGVEDDYTGLWELRKDAAQLTLMATESDLRAFVMPVVQAMLEEGSILAGDLTRNGFEAWGLEPSEAAERIRDGWVKVGTPNIADVVWFSSPEASAAGETPPS
jgi:hypothetical protein